MTEEQQEQSLLEKEGLPEGWQALLAPQKQTEQPDDPYAEIKRQVAEGGIESLGKTPKEGILIRDQQGALGKAGEMVFGGDERTQGAFEMERPVYRTKLGEFLSSFARRGVQYSGEAPATLLGAPASVIEDAAVSAALEGQSVNTNPFTNHEQVTLDLLRKHYPGQIDDDAFHGYQFLRYGKPVDMETVFRDFKRVMERDRGGEEVRDQEVYNKLIDFVREPGIVQAGRRMWGEYLGLFPGVELVRFIQEVKGRPQDRGRVPLNPVQPFIDNYADMAIDYLTATPVYSVTPTKEREIASRQALDLVDREKRKILENAGPVLGMAKAATVLKNAAHEWGETASDAGTHFFPISRDKQGLNLISFDPVSNQVRLNKEAYADPHYWMITMGEGGFDATLAFATGLYAAGGASTVAPNMMGRQLIARGRSASKAAAGMAAMTESFNVYNQSIMEGKPNNEALEAALGALGAGYVLNKVGFDAIFDAWSPDIKMSYLKSVSKKMMGAKANRRFQTMAHIASGVGRTGGASFTEAVTESAEEFVQAGLMGENMKDALVQAADAIGPAGFYGGSQHATNLAFEHWYTGGVKEQVRVDKVRDEMRKDSAAEYILDRAEKGESVYDEPDAEEAAWSESLNFDEEATPDPEESPGLEPEQQAFEMGAQAETARRQERDRTSRAPLPNVQPIRERETGFYFEPDFTDLEYAGMSDEDLTRTSEEVQGKISELESKESLDLAEQAELDELTLKRYKIDKARGLDTQELYEQRYPEEGAQAQEQPEQAAEETVAEQGPDLEQMSMAELEDLYNQYSAELDALDSEYEKGDNPEVMQRYAQLLDLQERVTVKQQRITSNSIRDVLTEEGIDAETQDYLLQHLFRLVGFDKSPISSFQRMKSIYTQPTTIGEQGARNPIRYRKPSVNNVDYFDDAVDVLAWRLIQNKLPAHVDLERAMSDESPFTNEQKKDMWESGVKQARKILTRIHSEMTEQQSVKEARPAEPRQLPAPFPVPETADFSNSRVYEITDDDGNVWEAEETVTLDGETHVEYREKRIVDPETRAQTMYDMAEGINWGNIPSDLLPPGQEERAAGYYQGLVNQSVPGGLWFQHALDALIYRAKTMKDAFALLKNYSGLTDKAVTRVVNELHDVVESLRKDASEGETIDVPMSAMFSTAWAEAETAQPSDPVLQLQEVADRIMEIEGKQRRFAAKRKKVVPKLKDKQAQRDQQSEIVKASQTDMDTFDADEGVVLADETAENPHKPQRRGELIRERALAAGENPVKLGRAYGFDLYGYNRNDSPRFILRGKANHEGAIGADPIRSTLQRIRNYAANMERHRKEAQKKLDKLNGQIERMESQVESLRFDEHYRLLSLHKEADSLREQIDSGQRKPRPDFTNNDTGAAINPFALLRRDHSFWQLGRRRKGATKAETIAEEVDGIRIERRVRKPGEGADGRHLPGQRDVSTLRTIFSDLYTPAVRRKFPQLYNQVYELVLSNLRSLAFIERDLRMANRLAKKVKKVTHQLKIRPAMEAIYAGDKAKIREFEQINPEIMKAAREIIAFFKRMREDVVRWKDQMYQTTMSDRTYEAYQRATQYAKKWNISTAAAARRAVKLMNSELRAHGETPVKLADVLDAIHDLEEIGRWGIEDYITNIEKGHIRIVDETGTTRAVATTVHQAREKAREIAAVRAEEIAKQGQTDKVPTLRIEIGNSMPDAELIEGTYAAKWRLQESVKKSLAEFSRELEKSIGKSLNVGTRNNAAAQAADAIIKVVPADVFAGPMQQRKNILRGDPNILEVLPTYINSMHRKMNMDPWLMRYRQIAHTLPPRGRAMLEDVATRMKGKYGVQDMAVDALLEGSKGAFDAVFGTEFRDRHERGAATRVVRKITAFQRLTKLGFRPMAAIVNFLGGETNVISQRGFRLRRQAEAFYHTREGQRIVDEENANNYLGTGSGVDLGAGEQVKNWLKGDFGAFALFYLAEKRTRETAYLTNYLWAKQEGMSEEAARDDARKALHTQLFLYSTPAIPWYFDNPAGRVVFQFKTYLYKQVQFLSSLSPKQLFRYMSIMWATGGINGALTIVKNFPFLDLFIGGTMDEVAEMFENAHASTFDFIGRNVGMQQFFNRKTGARAMAGLPGMLAGVDISAAAVPQISIEYGQAFGPALSDAWKITKMMREAYMTDYHDIKKGWQQMTEGEWPTERPFAIFEDLSPWLYYMSMLWDSYISPDGWIRDERGNKLYQTPQWEGAFYDLWGNKEKVAESAKLFMGAQPYELRRGREERAAQRRENRNYAQSVAMLRSRIVRTQKLTGEFDDMAFFHLVEMMGDPEAAMASLERAFMEAELPPEMLAIQRTPRVLREEAYRDLSPVELVSRTD